MVSLFLAAAAAVGTTQAEGLSGPLVRGSVAAPPIPAAPAVPPPASALGASDVAPALEEAARQVNQGVQHLAPAADALGAQGADAVQAASQAVSQAGAQVSSLGQPVFSWSGYASALGVLCLLLALLWAGLWLLRRYGRFNFMPRPGAFPRDALCMEAQMPLGPRKGLMVVRFLNRRLLLGVTDQQITLLTEEDVPHEQHGDFEQVMQAASHSAGHKPSDPSTS